MADLPWPSWMNLRLELSNKYGGGSADTGRWFANLHNSRVRIVDIEQKPKPPKDAQKAGILENMGETSSNYHHGFTLFGI